MLQAIRDKTSGWIAYFIIGLISIPFALWGVNSYLGGGEQAPAAIVDGNEISVRQLDTAYINYRERLLNVFGGNLPDIFADELTLKEQVLTQLIEDAVLMNYIDDKGFRVGDEQLFANIRSMQVFQQDGSFSKELYQNQLSSQGYSPAFFEFELRRNQQKEQLDVGIRTTAFTVPVMTERFQELQNQQRKVRTLTIVNQSDTIEVNDDEIQDYYQNNPALFMQPPRVRVNYIELSLNNIKRLIEVNEEDVVERYHQMSDQLTTAEIRNASHILLKTSDDDDSEVVKQKLLDIKQRIDAGESFADLAREFSEDPGSASDGGDLGEVEKGMMVLPFESALFDMQVGQVSEPVKTRFGWHLIQLHSVEGGETQTLEQARSVIENDIKNEMAESQIYDLSESLANIAFEQPDSLLPASEQLGLTIQTSEFFTRDQGTGIAENDRVRQAAFSEEVLKLNRNSESIELDNNRIAVIHLNEHEPETLKPLDQVRDQIVQMIKTRQGREMAESKGKALYDLLKQGTNSMQQIANSEGLEIVDSGFVGRSFAGLDNAVVSALFTMQKPAKDNPQYAGVTEVDGDYTIVEFSEIKMDENASDDQVKKQLVDSMSTYDYQALVKNLVSQADVTRTPVAELQ